MRQVCCEICMWQYIRHNSVRAHCPWNPNSPPTKLFVSLWLWSANRTRSEYNPRHLCLDMWRHTWGVGLYMTLWDCSAIAAIRIVTTEPLTPRTANLDTEKHATQIQIQIGTQYKKKENISQVTQSQPFISCTANLIDPYITIPHQRWRCKSTK